MWWYLSLSVSASALSSTVGNHWSEAEMDIGSDGIGGDGGRGRDWFDFDDRNRRRPSDREELDRPSFGVVSTLHGGKPVCR